MRLYIAGPMTGIAEFNFPAFDRAATKYRALGHDVISPAEHDRESGLDVTGLTGALAELEGKFDLAEALLWDLAQVASVDAVVLLEGWERSSGVRAELALAAALSKRVILDSLAVETSAREVVAGTSNPGETRVTNATTGGEKGTKEVRLDLVPIYPLTELARLYGRGAAKYADRNWERGYDWSLSYAALMRHVTQWWGGEDCDPEMGTSHMASVAWHAFTLAEFERTHPELDNRPTALLEDNK